MKLSAELYEMLAVGRHASPAEWAEFVGLAERDEAEIALLRGLLGEIAGEIRRVVEFDAWPEEWTGVALDALEALLLKCEAVGQ